MHSASAGGASTTYEDDEVAGFDHGLSTDSDYEAEAAWCGSLTADTTPSKKLKGETRQQPPRMEAEKMDHE